MPVISYRDAIRDALREEMRRDPSVFVLGEDIAQFGGSYKTCAGLFEEFGKERVRNTPLSENAIIGCALGAALAGMRPVPEIMYIDFTACCMDQIVNETAKARYMFGGKAKVAMVIRTQGGSGRSSAAQHAQSLEAWFMHTPGIYVVMPSTPYDAKGLLKASIRDDNPILFIEHKLLYNTKGMVPEEDYLVPLGTADIKRKGSDVTIITYSRGVEWSLEAASELSKEGIEAEVIDLRSLKPLDLDAFLSSVVKTGRAMVVHEACKTGGVGAEIVSLINENVFDYLDAPVERVAGLDIPIPFNPNLEAHSVPNKSNIVDAARRLLNRRQ